MPANTLFADCVFKVPVKVPELVIGEPETVNIEGNDRATLVTVPGFMFLVNAIVPLESGSHNFLFAEKSSFSLNTRSPISDVLNTKSLISDVSDTKYPISDVSDVSNRESDTESDYLEISQDSSVNKKSWFPAVNNLNL